MSSEQIRHDPSIVKTREWSSLEIRDQFEAHFGTPLASQGHEFGPRDGHFMLGAELVARGAAVKMAKDSGEDPAKYPVVAHKLYDANGTYSGGFLILGAPDRETADRMHPHFVDIVNEGLKYLDNPRRLSR